MLLQPLAREMVEAVSGMVEGRTINLMDTKGIIVASSDPARVGSFHQGAMEAVRTGKMVSITKEQVADYSGAREGCNMPLRVNGTIIGVVGIWGDPPGDQGPGPPAGGLRGQILSAGGHGQPPPGGS